MGLGPPTPLYSSSGSWTFKRSYPTTDVTPYELKLELGTRKTLVWGLRYIHTAKVVRLAPLRISIPGRPLRPCPLMYSIQKGRALKKACVLF